MTWRTDSLVPAVAANTVQMQYPGYLRQHAYQQADIQHATSMHLQDPELQATQPPARRLQRDGYPPSIVFVRPKSIGRAQPSV